MSQVPAPPQIEDVPLHLINVVNPRARNRKSFREMLDSIAQVGLKRPITVARRGTRFDLVCGQGRLEAFEELGQPTIPAIVISADAEDCLVMGLVENVARRQHQALELLHDIHGMYLRGHDEVAIARKTGLSLEYTKGVVRLIEKGEARLLKAVEVGTIPVSVAVAIAESEQTDTQRVLQDAYEQNLLRGHNLLAARRLIERRSRRGKHGAVQRSAPRTTLSADALLRAYQQDVDKKRMVLRRAETTRNRLVFTVEALRQLFAEESFVNLARAEGMETLPRGLSERILGHVEL